MGKPSALYVYSKGIKQADCSQTLCDSSVCYCSVVKSRGLGPRQAKRYVKSKKTVPSTFPMRRLNRKLNVYTGEYVDCYGKSCRVLTDNKKGRRGKAKCRCTKKKGKYMTIISKRKAKRASKRKSRKLYLNAAPYVKRKKIYILDTATLF